MRTASLPTVLLLASTAHAAADFAKQVAPLLAGRCVAFTPATSRRTGST